LPDESIRIVSVEKNRSCLDMQAPSQNLLTVSENITTDSQVYGTLCGFCSRLSLQMI
jgi:hypothetical protein